MSVLSRVAHVVLALAASATACVATGPARESSEPEIARPGGVAEAECPAHQGSVEPRALIATIADANGPAVSLGVHDRTGAKVAELLPSDGEGSATWRAFTGQRTLELGSPASLRERWSYRVQLPVDAIEGAPAPATSTTILLAARRGDGPQQVLGREPAGQQRFALTIDARWRELSPSPGGAYVFAGDGADQGAVFEAASGRTLWQGALVGGAFTDDDSAFVHVGADARHDVAIQPLPGGPPQVVAQPSALFTIAEPGAVHGPGASFLVPVSSTAHGLIFRVQGDVTFGTFLFVLADGRFHALAGPPVRFAHERLLALEDGGAVVVFSRHFTDGPRKHEAPTIFAHDLRTGERTTRPAPRERDQAALRERVEPFLGRSAGVDGWLLNARTVEAGGQRLIVGSLEWGLNPIPASQPDPGIVVLREDGTPLALLPVGEVAIDRTGTMLLHETWPHGRQRQVAIVDLRDGARATVDRAIGSAFVYE
ncbi:hypothetical protein [Nannocystis radixulma]|uniref:PQQ-like domain-containing protein n=1 Tax=Nannocystis radixulma TaxID=2995305 RepID=A0ABT5B314_9BACT|nr:hypothetical protein [Nannocystis radixulma]MDC0668499.1 hypothetical protein [Nannocystis radixulma]